MKLRSETKEQQSRLAEYCRTNNDQALIGVTPGRIGNYRRLVFGVIKDALSSSYPLAQNLLTEKEWNKLSHSFFEEHDCKDPQVWKMPFDLISYTEEHQAQLTAKYPQLLELLMFEWKEVEYYMMPDKDYESNMDNDFWDSHWSINRESEIITLSYPVHLKNARFISATDKGQYFCLIYRHPDTSKVHFLNLSSFFAWMLATMMSEPSSPKELFSIMTSQFGLTDISMVKKNIEPFFEKLKADGMLKVQRH